jgi:inosose dehydratase
MKRRAFLSTLGTLTAVSLAPLDALVSAASAADKFGITFGYAAITWGGNDLQAIDDVAAGGFKGIQLRSPILQQYGDKPAALKEILDKHKLTFVALSSGTVSIDPAKRQDELTKHVRNAKFVKDCGGLYLQVIDERPKGRAITQDDFTYMGKLLTEIGQRAADMGIGLGYHNHMNALGETPKEIAAVMAASDPKFLRLELDIAHYLQGGGDPIEAVKQYGDRILFLHIKDVISPVPGDTKEPSRSYKFVELGQGKVDIPGVLKALKALPFHGWAIVELDAVPVPNRTPKESLEISKKYIQEKLGLTV